MDKLIRGALFLAASFGFGCVGSVEPDPTEPAGNEPLPLVVDPSILKVCNPPAPGSDPTRASSKWAIAYPTPTSALYDCATGTCCGGADAPACTLGLLQKCTYTTTDIHDPSDGSPLHNLPTLALVANGMGGELRWNNPPVMAAALFGACGGTGTFFYSEKADTLVVDGRSAPGTGTRRIWEDQLEAYNVLLVELRWDLGAYLYDGAPMPSQGWFSRIDDTPRALPWAAQRPAAVLQFIKSFLPSGVPLGTSGCSGGSIQTIAPVVWYGLDSAVAYQYVSGPLPAVWDVPATCAPTQQAVGICENKPGRACTTAAACGIGFKCAFPQPTGTLDEPNNPLGDAVKTGIIDYGCMSAACSTGGADPCLNASSMSPGVPGAPAGNFTLTHQIDIHVDIEGSPTFMTDTNLGVTYNGGSFYKQLTCGTNCSKSYRYTTNGTHCSAFEHDNLSGTLSIIRGHLGV